MPSHAHNAAMLTESNRKMKAKHPRCNKLRPHQKLKGHVLVGAFEPFPSSQPLVETPAGKLMAQVETK
jgi:hypothetical protein